MSRLKRKITDDPVEEEDVNMGDELEPMETLEKNEIASKPCQLPTLRISDRLLRKKEEEERKETEFVEEVITNANEDKSADKKASVSKPRRTWEQWSPGDKSVFFEALNESGKNFDDIEAHFHAKFKKKNGKTKDQIKNFYYRTYKTKILKRVSFPSEMDLKKCTQELYGLINYGELRKRIGGTAIGEKNAAKLEELIFTGHTSVRVKGKTYRVKTPICPALISIMSKENPEKSIKVNNSPTLPNKIVLELKPSRQYDLSSVHGGSFQNPCLNLSIKPSVHLDKVLANLEKKWKPLSEKLKSNNQHANNKLSFQSDPLVNHSITKELWFMRAPGSEVSVPIFDTINPITSASLSLSNLKAKCYDGNADAKDATTIKGNGTKEKSLKTDGPLPSTATAEQKLEIKIEEKSEPPPPPEIFEWNKTTAGDLTLGELFLKFGKPISKTIEFRYEWRVAQGLDLSEVKAVSSLKHVIDYEFAKRQVKPTSPHHAVSANKRTVTTNGSSTTRSTGVVKHQKELFSTSPLAMRNNNNTQSSSPVLQEERNRPEFLKPQVPRMVVVPQSDQSLAFKQQVKRLLPKFSNRKGRPMSRKNVISRQLMRPVQPRATMQTSGGLKIRLVETNMMPVVSHAINLPSNVSVVNNIAVPKTTTTSSINRNNIRVGSTLSDIPQISIPESRPSSSASNNQVLSSPSFSSIFNDSSLSELSNVESPTKDDHFLDTVLENSGTSLLHTPPRQRSTPPSSPRALNESWLPELSLSSFLNLNESPSKSLMNHSGELNFVNEESSHSTNSEVDRNILSLMTENSIDFSMKFAKLASHVNDAE